MYVIRQLFLQPFLENSVNIKIWRERSESKSPGLVYQRHQVGGHNAVMEFTEEAEGRHGSGGGSRQLGREWNPGGGVFSVTFIVLICGTYVVKAAATPTW